MEDTGSCAESSRATLDGKKSRGISADAAPFTPRSIIVSSVLSPTAPEFYPRNYAALFQNNTSTMTNTNTDLLAEIRQIVATLISQPADFERVMTPCVQSLMSSVQDEATLGTVVEELVTQSVRDVNFRYSGARTCWYLCQHLKYPFGNFGDQLFARCRTEYTDLVSSPTPELSRLIGAAMFLAELLFSMKDSDSAFLLELPEKVAQLVLKLVERNTREALQSAVQVLKLTGAILERHGVDLNPVFAKLETCSLNSELTQFLISGVAAQRAANWGQSDSEIVTTSGAGDTKNAETGIRSTDEAVYFDGSNHGYPVDEAEDFEGYIGWPGTSGSNINVDGSIQYWIGDQVMDADTATAFEEFIAGSESPPVANYWSYQP